MNAIESLVRQTMQAEARLAPKGGRPIRFESDEYGPKVAAMRSLGASYRDIAFQFQISPQTAANLLKRWRHED